jgi:hypothetical protein
VLPGVEMAVAAYNGTVAILGLLLLAWTVSLARRFLALFQERRIIRRGAVLVLSEDDDHPEWLERAYVARLLNRRERAVASHPVATLEVPFAVLSVSGAAHDPYAASAAAEVVCGDDGVRGGHVCFLFGVERASWTALKERGFTAAFSPQKHAVVASDWTPIDDSKTEGKVVVVRSSDCQLLPGKHYPHRDDVALLFLLRHGAVILALSCASDARVLETIVFPGDGGAPLSIRETYSEEDPDCLVCCAMPRNTVLLPCRHSCCCSQCLARLDKCPVCRAAVESFVSFGPLEEHVVAPAPADEDPDAIALQEIIRRDE